MDIAFLNPFVRYIDKRTYIPTYSEYVFAYDHRMFFVTKGRVEIIVSDKSYILSENKAVIIPPGTPYKLNSSLNLEYFIVNFDFVCENTSSEPAPPVPKESFEKNRIFNSATSEFFPLLLSCTSDMAYETEGIFNAYIKKYTLYREFMSCELKRIIINSMIFTERDKSPKLINNITNYINQNLSEKLTNAQIAHEFSYHPNYVNRVFKENMGKTLKAYITELKLKKAKELLKTTELGINDISELCGFESYSYFIKVFRIHQGISPLKYRKENSRLL